MQCFHNVQFGVLLYVSHKVTFSFVETNTNIFKAINPCNPETNIYFEIKLINSHILCTNGYICCFTSVATFQHISHWLPTHIYVLPYILATPKNATHTESVGTGSSNANMDI
jgi:hypothetical protein